MSTAARIKFWALVVTWVLYVVFLGPYLMSAASWELVATGAVLLVSLFVLTIKFINKYLTE
jgi:hypothetical protein